LLIIVPKLGRSSPQLNRKSLYFIADISLTSENKSNFLVIFFFDQPADIHNLSF